jgi:hypothetical protein
MSAPSRRSARTTRLNWRGAKPVNGAIQDGSDAVITRDTVEIIAEQDHIRDSPYARAHAELLTEYDALGVIPEQWLHSTVQGIHQPLRAKDVCEALGRELLPKNVEGTRSKLKLLAKLGILTEADTGNFTRKQ